LNDKPTVNVINLGTSPEWLTTRSVYVAALDPFPDAKAAVIDALSRLVAIDALEAGNA
jgi:hypothetical protein